MLGSVQPGAAEWAYLPLEILIRSLVRRMFRMFGRPFEADRVDDRVSRRDECISTGRERPGSSPRGPGVVLELLRQILDLPDPAKHLRMCF